MSEEIFLPKITNFQFVENDNHIILYYSACYNLEIFQSLCMLSNVDRLHFDLINYVP